MKPRVLLCALCASVVMFSGCGTFGSIFHARGESGPKVPAAPVPGPTLVEMRAAAALYAEDVLDVVYERGAPPQAAAVQQAGEALQAARHSIGQPTVPWPVQEKLETLAQEVTKKIGGLRRENAKFGSEKRQHGETVAKLSREPTRWSWSMGSGLLQQLVAVLAAIVVLGSGGLAWLIKRLRSTSAALTIAEQADRALKQIVGGIEKAKIENPGAAEAVMQRLSNSMDTASKRVVDDIRRA